LEGIGTNLLSARLKSLQAAGVVVHAELPAPAGVAAYALTARGETLKPILEDLALWGFELIRPSETPNARSRAVWAAMSMLAQMDRSEPQPPDGLYEFMVGEERFWLRVLDGVSELRDGPAPLAPDARVIAELSAFLGVASGALDAKDADLRVQGDTSRVDALLRTFRLPIAPAEAI